MSLLNRQKILSNVKEIREAANVFLNDTCIIKHRVGEVVTLGEAKAVYEDETVECRWIVRSGTTTTNLASQERATQQTVFVGVYRMQLPFGTVINENDRIQYTDATEVTRLFEVVYVPPQHDMMGAFVIGLQELT